MNSQASIPIDPDSVGAAPRAVVKPRLWPAIVILATQVLALVLTVTPAINNAVRFGFMMLGPATSVLLFAAWLILASRQRWRDRFTMLFGIVASGVLVGLIVDSTMLVPLWIYGVPLSMCITTVVLLAGGRWAPSARTVTVVAAVACGWAVFLLARNEGFYGNYWPQFRWRWSENSEMRLARESFTATESAGVASIELEVLATDWPGFRGAQRDSHVRKTSIQTDWNTTPPRELWRIPVGAAWSSFAGVGDRLFTQEQRGDSEVVVCYDANSGDELWRYAEVTRFSDVVSGAGPRATPTFAAGRLYTFGGRALLNCLNAVSGELLWQRDLMTEIDAQLPPWGFAASPVVSGDTVIVYAGGSNDRGLVAYDAATGKPRWHIPGSGMNFSSAQLVTLSDRQLVLLASTARLVAVEPDTGNVIWQYKHNGRRSMAIVQPQQISASSLIVPFGDGGGIARIDVELVDDAWQVTERWASRNLKPSFNDFVYHDGHLYGFDQNIFTCIDAETGQRRWKRGRFGFGQVILFEVQGLLLITTEHGEIVLLEANPNLHTEVARFEALTGKTWNHPIVVRHRLVVRNNKEAVCYDLSAGAE